MYQIRIMNGATAGKSKAYQGTTMVGEILTDPELSGILTGSTYHLNGEILTPDDYNKTLDEMGLNTEKPNFLVSVKAANGN